MSDATPLVSKEEDLRRYDGQTVRLRGAYEAVPRPAKGLRPSNEPRTHALIRMSDGVAVYLEPIDQPNAKRSPSERRRFDSRQVAAIGTLHNIMPSMGAGLIAPCLSNVREIEEIAD